MDKKLIFIRLDEKTKKCDLKYIGNTQNFRQAEPHSQKSVNLFWLLENSRWLCESHSLQIYLPTSVVFRLIKYEGWILFYAIRGIGKYGLTFDRNDPKALQTHRKSSKTCLFENFWNLFRVNFQKDMKSGVNFSDSIDQISTILLG